MSIAAKSPSNQTEGGSSRSRGPSGASAGLAGTPPFSGAGRAAQRISASLSPGRRVFFDDGAVCGYGIGAIGSGSTVGAGWLDAAPYEWEPIGSSAMRALPNAAGACEPEAGSEGAGPASQGNEDESSGCGGAGRKEGEESMKDSGDGQGSVEYRLGTLGAKAEGAQEGLKDLSKRVDDGFGRLDQRIDDLSKRVDDGFERQNQRVDDGFGRLDQRIDDLSKRVDDGFERQNQRVDDGFGRLDQRVDDLSKRVDDGFEKQRQEIKSDFEKQSEKIEEGFQKAAEQYNNSKIELRKAVVALVVGLILAAAGAYFTGLF